MNMSLDGVVSDPDKWMIFSDEILEESLAAYDQHDAILVGSNTYPSLAEYWQNAEESSDSALERSFAKKINEIRKIVISQSPVDLVWANSEQLTIKDWESFAEVIKKLKESDGKTISVESGLKTWQLFLENSLFDELRIVIHPVIAGQGDKLFSDEAAKSSLQLMSSRLHKNGVISLTYQRN